MSTSKENTKEVGNLGEHLACNYLKNKGFTIIEQNFWRKWGEIDIVARKKGIVYFVEVKTVSYETKDDLQSAISRGTWRPEEQVHERKLHQIDKALQTWISEHGYSGEWFISVLGVRIVPHETYATMNFIENVGG